MERVETTYRVEVPSKEYWIGQDGQAVECEPVRECGHRHRTPDAARRCLARMGDAAAWHGARVAQAVTR